MITEKELNEIKATNKFYWDCINNRTCPNCGGKLTQEIYTEKISTRGFVDLWMSGQQIGSYYQCQSNNDHVFEKKIFHSSQSDY